ncbi:c-type cytochrome [Pedobacter insulae]|uniref:Cytochrome c n=1 Tax=Pedobacter insulae TaxID=414048 RepID=A0A1I2TWD7_9SPHI|nr:c-type cytochrome [Pedobacter insulae]SFG66651.1 cytochrome c [Pedobacter insulae]
MKKTLLILSTITLILAACGGSSTDTTEKSTSTPAPASTQPTKSGGELLIAKSDCIGCHHKENKIIGPSYQAIADKYPSNEENINLLAGKIISGGKGVWGTVPMTPHAKITESDAKEMVTYILSLKK